MRALSISIGAFVLFASGAFALTECSSHSSDGSSANGSDGGTASNSDTGAAAPGPGCSDEDTPCPPDVPTAGDTCFDVYGCDGENFTCNYACTPGGGGQNLIAKCTNGTWIITPTGSSTDCAIDAGPDASAADAGDGGD